MKKSIQLTFLFVVLSIFSNAMAVNAFMYQQTDTTIFKVNSEYYVSAKSGLNYRNIPNGEVLGKFKLNEQLKVVQKTSVFDTITDGNKTITGEWLGVIKEIDTAFIFSAFLSSEYTESDLKIYYASPYHLDNNGVRQGFVNVSESYQNYNYDNDNPTILYQKSIGKDTIQLDNNQRSKFLKRINISELDTVFVYNLSLDSIFKFKVKSLPLIACVNIYDSGGSSEGLEEYSYEFGFSLEKKYKSKGDNFTIIGKINPFQTGGVKAIVWQPIKVEDFPKKFDSSMIDKSIISRFDYVLPKETFKFNYNNYDYYIQKLKDDGIDHSNYLVIINTATNKIVFNDVFMSSEGSYLTPLNLKDEKPQWGQWTGNIFKNKPPILYGFLSQSFGCQGIRFLSKTEPPIRILCDNRH